MKNRISPILILVCMISVALLLTDPSEVFCKSSNNPEVLLDAANRCRKSLYASAKKMKYRHNWLNCIKRYEKIYKRYPRSDEAAWALYFSGRLYTGLYRYSGKSKDLDQSLAMYRKLAAKHKNHRLADDAQYMVGMIFYENFNDATQAYVEFLKVEIKFPSGDMVPKARKKLKHLEVALNKKDEKRVKTRNPSSKNKLIAVKNIRHWSTPNYTRVVIDVASPVKYKHHLLRPDPDKKKPRRLYLDLDNTRVTKRIDSPVEIKDGLLQLARAGQYKKDTVRVVLDMESIGGYDVFRLHDPFRIVVDVRRHKDGKARGKSTAARKKSARKGVRKSDSQDKNVSLARQLGLNVKRIVIDPGHGGKDPGCNGRHGVKEKDIVLSLAKTLAKKIREEMGCEVFLTRSSDTFISLEKRTAIANIKKADLFISLHVNAHKRSSVWGIETYYLNMATDERSVMVAARENATSQKNISDLQTILNKLMMNTKINESNRLAHEVQKGMVSQIDKKYKKPRDLGVKQAPFYVLIGADMPSVLVETGFLTNPAEKKKLLNSKYRESVASGICAGIKSYVKSIDKVYQGG